MKKFPVYQVKKVWHVGMMDVTRKGNGSYEGSGLSVSECPLAWQEIAQLSGDYFSLKKKKGTFLDFHKLSDEQREEITQWGLANGYVTKDTLYQYILSDEDGEEMYGIMSTYEKALAEVDEEEECVIELPNSMVPTQKLIDSVKGDSLINTFDFLVTVYNEEVLHLDGVWFHDTMDRYAYSAPRGVIALNRLDSWKVKKVSENKIPIWGSRYEE